MVKIHIGNSTSKINGLISIPFKKLRKALSYTIDSQAAYFSGRHFNTTRYCINTRGEFATGLLPRVEQFLEVEKIQYEVDCTEQLESVFKIRKVDHKGDFTGITPYTWQLEAVDAAVDQHRMIVSATTGTGKSLAIALLTARLCVRTLIIVPSLQIKEELTATFKGIFKDISNITIENIDSSALDTTGNYDLLIIDEGHHVAAKTYQNLNKNAWKNIYYRYFFTATPFRNQTEETMLFEGVAGTHMYKLPYKRAVSERYIVPIEAYYIELPKVATDAYTWQQVYSGLVVNNKNRNDVIARLMISLHAAKVSTLCLVKEIEHGNNIVKMLAYTPFANGQDDATRKHIKAFNQGKLTSLIGTTGILGEGVDTKPCEYVIIAGLGKAKSAFMQNIGRGVRKYANKESAKVIIFKDRSHKFLIKHFNAQCKILLDEYGVKPVKLEV